MKKHFIKLIFENTSVLRKTLYISLGTIDKFFGKKALGINILCYHSISEDNWFHGVSFKQLKSQLEFLVKKYKVISLDQAKKILQNKTKIAEPLFVITIDDGYKNVYKTKELFKSLNIKPTLFILSDQSNANRKELENSLPFLSKKEILDLKKDDWIIGCHSATHVNFSNLTNKELEDEIVKSKKSLEKYLGFSVEYFAYPKGIYNAKVLEAIKRAGYSFALSMDDGVVSSASPKHALPRIGINRSHNLLEFQVLFSPSVGQLREFIKKRIFKI